MPKQLRIAFCLPEFVPFQQVWRSEAGDAAYIQQKSIAEGLLGLGHKLTFVAPLDRADLICASASLNVTIAPRSWSNTPMFRLISRSAWQLQRWLGIPYLNIFSNYRFCDACLHCLPGHDVVYERNGIYGVGVAMACRRLNLPYVLFFDADQIAEHDYMGKPIQGLLRRRALSMLRYNLETAQAVICVSEPAKTHLISARGVPSEKVVVFPNGVDTHKFYPDAQGAAAVRNMLCVQDKPMILFVGNFYEWHDVITLLRAFASVVELFPHVRLVLVGDGATRPAMEQQAADLGLGNASHFVGLVPHRDVPRYLAAADIAVLPYPAMQREMWLSPLKLFEYMAAGKAIVAAAAGQVADVICNGRNGLLVPPGDVVSMAEALKKLVVDDNLRAQLGRQARTDAEQKHSWEQYAARLEWLLTAVASGGWSAER